MKIKLLIVGILLAGAHNSLAQSNIAGVDRENAILKTAPMYTALYILKSDLRSIELDPKKKEFFDVKSIDQKQVKFVTVLSGKEGKKLYGDKGSNGVVIVQLADFYDLSKEALTKLSVDN